MVYVALAQIIEECHNRNEVERIGMEQGAQHERNAIFEIEPY